jgi:hypothetical protein
MLLKQLVTPVTKRSSFASAIRASSGSVHCSTMVLDVTACWVAMSETHIDQRNVLGKRCEPCCGCGKFRAETYAQIIEGYSGPLWTSCWPSGRLTV